ncbi:cell signaling regulator [Achromobacter denitrificans]|uniref:sensor domain-containing diguanylate cyclase n=1 Tax=Achromobacter denitrificans TaxID=32002 RepID=UPI001667D02E|nr:sensor domain-containing diguanylate cyclase [Achromobacter denitrificans]GFN24367.1 cell signaling regulator [Achromobacter denitrificans]
MFRIDLRRLILWISLLSVILVLAGGLHASYLVQRDLLLRNALDVNQAYASKLASATDTFLTDLQRYLAYSADMLSDMETRPQDMGAETRRQEQQLGHFNSSFVVSPQGKVLAVSTSSPQLLGQNLVSEAFTQALSARRPTISEPFQTRSGRWVILYTHPIVSPDYRYLGYIAGTLYLHEDNVLDRLLGQHFYRDDSSLLVVDRNGTLIYHPDRSRLGQRSPDNEALAAARRGETGEMRYTDDRGREMLAGYAPVPSTGWSIVAQRPVDNTLQPLSDLLMATASNTLPLLLLSVASIWLLSRWIARPLGELAGIAKHMQNPDSADRIRKVRSWYFEAAQLKRALLMGLASLHHKIRDLRRETTTDTLTGLLNRRGLDEALALLQAEDEPVAIVAIDIDHFKNINDRYGHAAGDRALQALARLMSEGSRSGDTLARAGGEEFVMLLPGAPMAAAIAIVERLRQRMAALHGTVPAPITISAGVAAYPEHGTTLDAVYQRADQALYYAKNHGRNAVCVADDNTQAGSRSAPPA